MADVDLFTAFLRTQMGRGQRKAGLIAYRSSLSACILPIWFLTVTVTSWLGWMY